MTTTDLIDYLKQGRPVHRKIVKEIIAALEAMKWRTDEPPRDRMFLARIKGVPGTTICQYSPSDNGFVWPNFCVNMIAGEWNDFYFETEHSPAGEIEAWTEVPG